MEKVMGKKAPRAPEYMNIALDGGRVQVTYDGNGNPVLIIQGERLPHFEGAGFSHEFQDYLQDAGVGLDAIWGKVLDAVQAESRIAAIRRVLL